MEIVDHLLTDDTLRISRHYSPNKGGNFILGQPDTIIIHYTAGRNARESINSLCNPAHKASAHLVIGRDDSISQLVPFNKVAWHAGKSSYQGRSGFNQFSIGIEIDNCGYLTQHGSQFLSWFGSLYPPEDVFQGKHRNPNVKYEFWLRYTEWQIAIVQELCNLLVDFYRIKNILGHEEISTSRKIDPGPAFPLDKMRDRILNTDRSSDEPDEGIVIPLNVESNIHKKVIVICDKLNIRAYGDLRAQKVAPPLVKDTVLVIIDESMEWYKVYANVEGWVSKKYVKLMD